MKRFVIFLLINFGALFLGSWLMGSPVENVWYQSVNKAPWTPPGWVFGVAWFSIMFCFAIYLSKSFDDKQRSWWLIYGIHLVLNISWNPIFFQKQLVVLGLIILVLLFFTLLWFVWKGKDRLSKLFLIPYLLWMCVAISLNAYILFNN